MRASRKSRATLLSDGPKPSGLRGPHFRRVAGTTRGLTNQHTHTLLKHHPSHTVTPCVTRPNQHDPAGPDGTGKQLAQRNEAIGETGPSGCPGGGEATKPVLVPE